MVKRLAARFNTLIWKRILKHLPDRNQVSSLETELLGNQCTQRSLYLQYRSLITAGGRNFPESGFRVYSQGDEDGLLLYLFAAVGFSNRVCVEIGSALPRGSNSTNLICNWGFMGLLVEGDPEKSREAGEFFRVHPDTAIYPPKCVSAWVTAENINAIIEQNGVSGEVDLFSLDLDGVDYWIWRALSVIRPRVVVLEFQDIWGADRSVTVPYDARFMRPDATYNYCGASLPAMVKLSAEKGYRLVGVNRNGQNAFFVRSDLAAATLPTVATSACFQNLAALKTYASRVEEARKREWVEV